MSTITIYTTRFCPFCIRAKQLLKHKKLKFNEISVDGNPMKRAEMKKKAGRNTVPQIWVGQKYVGGCDDLFALESANKLDPLLNACNG